MCRLVDRGQTRKIQVGVDLGGADVGVTQQFLHPSQITAGFEQMRGKRMTEHMRVYMRRQALAARPGVNPQLHGPRRQRPVLPRTGWRTARRDDIRLQQPGPLHQPLVQRSDGMAANGHDARLVALAEHPHGSILEIKAERSNPTSSLKRSPDE